MGCSGIKARSQNCLDSKGHGRLSEEACLVGPLIKEDGSKVQRVGKFA